MASNSAPSEVPKIVTLNVGGKMFATRSATLMRCGFFERMLNGHWDNHINQNENSFIFVDRNPDVFTYVLDFLRGSYVFPTDNIQLLKKIEEEADFFDVPSLSSALGLNANLLVDITLLTKNNEEKHICKLPKSILNDAKYNGLHDLLFACDENYERKLHTLEFLVFNRWANTKLKGYNLTALIILLDAFTYGGQCARTNLIIDQHVLDTAKNYAMEFGISFSIIDIVMKLYKK